MTDTKTTYCCAAFALSKKMGLICQSLDPNPHDRVWAIVRHDKRRFREIQYCPHCGTKL